MNSPLGPTFSLVLGFEHISSTKYECPLVEQAFSSIKRAVGYTISSLASIVSVGTSLLSSQCCDIHGSGLGSVHVSCHSEGFREPSSTTKDIHDGEYFSVHGGFLCVP